MFQNHKQYINCMRNGVFCMGICANQKVQSPFLDEARPKSLSAAIQFRSWYQGAEKRSQHAQRRVTAGL